MTADSSPPLTARERRSLDALAVGLAADPTFVTAMRPARVRRTGSPRAARGGPLALVLQAAALLGACLLAGVISIGALLLGPPAVLALGPAILLVVGLLALRRRGGGRS